MNTKTNLYEYRENKEIDLSDSLLNKYLRSQNTLTEKIKSGANRLEISRLEQESKILEQELDQRLGIYSIDARYKNFRGPQKRKPIKNNDIATDINNTIKDLIKISNIEPSEKLVTKPRIIENKILNKDNKFNLDKITYTSTQVYRL